MRRAFAALGEYSEVLNSNQVHMDNPQTEVSSSQWKAPDRGNFKCNCDVALCPDGKRAKLAAVLRDWRGHLVNGVVGSAYITSLLQGELCAIRLALWYGQRHGA